MLRSRWYPPPALSRTETYREPAPFFLCLRRRFTPAMLGAETGSIPPTSCLPPVKKIPYMTLDSLNNSIQYLRSVYNPEVRGSRRRPKLSAPNNTPKPPYSCTSTPLPTLSLHHLRTDRFERAHAIRWLTALISILEPFQNDESPEISEGKEKTIQNAASLLAIFAGASAAGLIIRDFTFFYHPISPTNSNPNEIMTPITIKLTDLPLNNDDYASVGAQTWGGACLLSEMLVENPAAFGIRADQLIIDAQARSTFRVLELGAGTGLVSLTIGKLLSEMIRSSDSRRVEIVATDYYPSVIANLRSNITANIPAGINSPIVFLVHALDWSTFNMEDTKFEPFDQPFDMVLGADIVYEPDHTRWIHSCLGHLLRKPSSPTCVKADANSAFFHLVIPLRKTHSFESSTVESVFVAHGEIGEPSLQVLAKNDFTCETETGEVEYSYYRIGWI